MLYKSERVDLTHHALYLSTEWVIFFFVGVNPDSVWDSGWNQGPGECCPDSGLSEWSHRCHRKASSIPGVQPGCTVRHGQRAPSGGGAGGVCPATHCRRWRHLPCGFVLTANRKHCRLGLSGFTDGRRICNTTKHHFPVVRFHKNTASGGLWVQRKLEYIMTTKQKHPDCFLTKLLLMQMEGGLT